MHFIFCRTIPFLLHPCFENAPCLLCETNLLHIQPGCLPHNRYIWAEHIFGTAYILIFYIQIDMFHNLSPLCIRCADLRRVFWPSFIYGICFVSCCLMAVLRLDFAPLTTWLVQVKVSWWTDHGKIKIRKKTSIKFNYYFCAGRNELIFALCVNANRNLLSLYRYTRAFAFLRWDVGVHACVIWL